MTAELERHAPDLRAGTTPVYARRTSAEPTSFASVARVVPAAPEVVYNILSDYRRHHQHILPKPYFVHMHVEQGGVGEGTVVHVEMQVMGAWQELRLEVSEPEPGRRLRERDLLSGTVTDFIIEPQGGGETSRVTLQTTWPRERGIRGWLQGKTTERVARHIYARELSLLSEYVREVV